MNILDIGIVIFILFGAVLGFKRGLTNELVKTVGFIVVVILAYFLKNPLSVLMYEHLPFFEFGILKNVEILNILIYEALAFIICVIVLSIVLKILMVITNIFEKILKATIILSIPSKLAGAVVGVIYHFIISFIFLYVVSLIFYDVDYIEKSICREKILNNTPILSDLADNSVKVINEFIVLKNKYNDKAISESEFNNQAIQLFLKYDVITKESLDRLVELGKIEKY